MTLAIGGVTIAELQARMGHDEFIEWLAYYSIEPFGGLRADIHAALVATMIANTNRDPKKRKTPFKPADFMPDWWKDKAQEGPAQVAGMLAKMQMLGGDETSDHETTGR